MRLKSVRTKRVDVPNDPDKGYINIQNLSEEQIAQIDAKYFEISDGGVRMINYATRDGDFAKACLTGWGNLFDESGREMKFNPKNVEKASAFGIETVDDKGKDITLRFFTWVNEEREKFAEEVEAEEKLAEKN